MTNNQTLIELLERSGSRIAIYDIGRRIGRLSRDLFLAFEQATAPYPLPMQRKAWFALVQEPPGSESDPVIWFLRLDLDEQGLLVQATRDYLLSRLLESAQANQSGNDAQTLLNDNPFAFSPKAERMALFNARLGADTNREPSRFYAHALDYFRGVPGWDQWEFVGYQGIADVACRHGDQPLTTAIPHLPFEPLQALCHCLESQQPSAELTAALANRLAEALAGDDNNPALLAALVRAVSTCTDDAHVAGGLATLLNDPRSQDIEVLAALSGRAWRSLLNSDLLNKYLARLASPDLPDGSFAACVDDLLSLPDMATTVRTALRDPNQASTVRGAFGRMLSGR